MRNIIISLSSIVIEIIILIILYRYIKRKKRKAEISIDFKERENYKRVSKILDKVKSLYYYKSEHSLT